MADWYVLQTKARHEAVAEWNLGNQEFNTFLPMLRVQRHLRGRWQPVSEPLFSGYMFIELDLGRQDTAPIRSTRGVIRLVRQGESLQPFPESLLQALMQAQAVCGEAIDPASVFKSGDEVRMINGPMAGLTGIFKAKNSQERVVVLLNILGKETQVSVSPHNISNAV